MQYKTYTNTEGHLRCVVIGKKGFDGKFLKVAETAAESKTGNRKQEAAAGTAEESSKNCQGDSCNGGEETETGRNLSKKQVYNATEQSIKNITRQLVEDMKKDLIEEIAAIKNALKNDIKTELKRNTNKILSCEKCTGYKELNSPTRKKTTKYHKKAICDNSTFTRNFAPDWQGPGWYRVTGQAGSQLADSPVEKHHCGTLASGWMAEGHPTVGEGEVIRTVN